MDQMVKQNLLVILGNGFDVSCNLPSGYVDFFRNDFNALNFDNDELKRKMINWLLKYIDVEESGSNETLHKYILTELGKSKDLLKENQKISDLNLNDWDLLFLYAYFFTQNDKWNFVESIIEMTVEAVSSSKKKNYEKYRSLFDNNSDMYLMIIVAKLLFNKDDKDLNNMLAQLNKFEQKFSNYINKKVSDSESENSEKETYKEKAINTLKKIIGSEEQFQNINIVSFNYSLDARFTKDFKEKTNLTINSWNNIHGVAAASDSTQWSSLKAILKARNNNIQFKNVPPKIIFGINSVGIGSTDSRYKFTKEYRKKNSDNDQVNTVNELVDGKLPSVLNKVIFFGHSLSEADHYELRKLLKRRVKDDTQFVIYIYDRNKTKDDEFKKNLEEILFNTEAKNIKHLSLKDS